MSTFLAAGVSTARDVDGRLDPVLRTAAISIVTKGSAHYLRADDDIGVIAPGRYADFLVLAPDPLKDV